MSNSTTVGSAPTRSLQASSADGDDEQPAKVVRNGKLYTVNRATKPFLKSHRWPAKTTTTKEKMLKESSPPYERASDVSRSILRYSALLVLGTLLLSRMFTESWTWGVSNKYTNLNNWIPRQMQTFTETQLMAYDGSDESRPIYLALDGEVFDVSANPRMYGKDGAYNHFAGRDAARAFVTGCFQQHLTHDTRGFSEKETQSLEGWKKFFRNHAKYYKIGTVLHEPIPQDAPLPPPCDAQAEGGASDAGTSGKPVV